MSRIEASLLADLQGAGFPVDMVSDLFGKRLDYRSAIPILLKWLPLADSQSLQEEIVRALSVKWARPVAAPALIKLFPLVDDPTGLGAKWVIANALAVVADDSVLLQIVSLVRSKEYGRSREMLVVALGNMKDNSVDEVLLELLNDDEVAGHALLAIRKRKAALPEAKPEIQRLTKHSKPWIRNEAARTLKAVKWKE